MPVDSKKQILKIIKQRNYLNKDFSSFRTDLLTYARTYFGDKIKDFSETSLGGLLLEMPAYVGDVQSFYLDHQFQELSVQTAVEARNIQRLLTDAGVDITGASPAVVNTTFYVEVPADQTVSPRVPLDSALPYIFAGTISQADNGTQFELTEDLDFTQRDNAGNLLATFIIGKQDKNNQPTTFILSLTGLCISGFRATETYSVGANEIFKQISLSNENVTDIISVIDGFGNVYYEVEYLSQDTVFQSVLNMSNDNDVVESNLMVIPAPYRFISNTDVQTRLTTLTFGGGSGQTLTDDIVPDPSQFSVPLYGKTVFSRFTLDPGNLLNTTTLGVLAANTNLTIVYRYGGGLSHNVINGAIKGVKTLNMTFPNGPSPADSSFVRASTDASNLEDASGGDDAPTLNELKLQVPSTRFAQSRIVTKEDVLARIYTMPSNFGRVFRASIRSNPNNPLASQLFIISRNASSQLTVSPDALKKNLVTYLNQFRMISDAIDILDAKVVDLQVQFTVVTDPTFNKTLVLQTINGRLKTYFNIKNFEIDQPLILSDLTNIIYNNSGVVSVQSVTVKNITGTTSNGTYSDVQFDIPSNTIKGILVPPAGGIFEIRFPDVDIIGSGI